MSDTIKKEQLFLQKLQSLVADARKKGNTVSEEEIEEHFRDLDLSSGQMDQVRAYLSTQKIGVGEPLQYEDVITEEEHDYMEDYEAMIAALPALPDGVFHALKLSAMAGDRDAQSRLTEAMLSRVIDIARLYAGQGVLMEDLIGGGNEALTVGVTLLGPLEKAEEVEGFLGRRIMDAMEDMIAANMDERAGDKAVEDKVNRVAKKAAELAGELLRKVTPQELAAEGELTLEEILEAVRFSGNKIEDIDTEQGSGEGL